MRGQGGQGRGGNTSIERGGNNDRRRDHIHGHDRRNNINNRR